MKIGLPRMFYYYAYPDLWRSFFGELGHETVVSKPSSQETIALAAAVTEAEHCLPNKLFDGHVASLRGKVDVIFVPRIISMVKGHIACPRFGALPEATRVAVAQGTKVVSVDLNETNVPLQKSLVALGRKLGASGRVSRRAAKVGMATFEAALSKQAQNARQGSGPRVLVLGHPYTLHDRFIGTPIFQKLKRLGVVPEPVTFEERAFAPGEILWCTFAKMYKRLQHLDKADFIAVVQISTFNCGADTMMVERFRRHCARNRFPYMLIMVDEHTGQAGLDTRLEAFVDSISWQKRRAEAKPVGL